jgi:hypothetical protein|tara:strand:- start:1387 stop:1530 length:144 start_codon:yes stop_codon:yes gene_type:complete
LQKQHHHHAAKKVLSREQKEKENFDLSIKAVKDLLAEAQKIDSGLKN